MKKQEISLQEEVIKERAETGGSYKCAICGKEKKTKKSKTCQVCARKFSGVGKMVDQSVKNYEKGISTEVKEIIRLSYRGREVLLEEIGVLVENYKKKTGEDCPDEIIAKRICQEHGLSEELSESAVREYRKRERCRELTNEHFDIDQYYEDKDGLIDFIHRKGPEFKPVMISHIVDELARVEDEKILDKMRELAQRKVSSRDLNMDTDPKSRAYKRACQISEEEGGIYGISFKKLLRAVAERMQELEESFKKIEAEREEGERVRGKQRAEKAGRQNDLLQEILSRPRVDLRTYSGQKKFGFRLNCREEADLLKDNSIVVLNDSIYQVNKSNGGHISLKHLNLIFSDPITVNQVAESKEPDEANPVKLNIAWVVCPEIASEAIRALRLTKQQMGDTNFISGLPQDSLVVEDVVQINNVPLLEVKTGELVKVGPCRKASRRERNNSSEYQPQTSQAK